MPRYSPAARLRGRPDAAQVMVIAVVGLAAAVATGVAGWWQYAAPAGWDLASVLYLAGTWTQIAGMDAASTATYATREDPSRNPTRLIVTSAAVASLLGVGYLLVQAAHRSGLERGLAAGLGVTSIALSWLIVHTIFTLRYAAIYYQAGRDQPGRGIDFNQDNPPRYTDFAYLGFTVGMTYQVSDTSLTSEQIRATVMRHALLSFVFGSLILASSVNLIASLAST